jgi:hypothetical protein
MPLHLHWVFLFVHADAASIESPAQAWQVVDATASKKSSRQPVAVAVATVSSLSAEQLYVSDPASLL